MLIKSNYIIVHELNILMVDNLINHIVSNCAVK